MLQNPTHNYVAGGPYLVSLIVTSNTGKVDTFSTLLNVINKALVVSATASPNIVCSGTSTILTGSGAVSYSWSGGVSNGVAFVPLSKYLYCYRF